MTALLDPARVQFSFPIAKAYEEVQDNGETAWVIEGDFTDESTDSQRESMEYEGSLEASALWKGNLHEMHDDRTAVGHSLVITPNPEKRSIHCKAFISKGAPLTWAKILDGTLRDFSVGGIRKVWKDTVDAAGQALRIVTKWVMDELSVVDVGANQNAHFQLAKMQGNRLVRGALLESPTTYEAPLVKTYIVLDDAGIDDLAARLFKRMGVPTPTDTATTTDTATEGGITKSAADTEAADDLTTTAGQANDDTTTGGTDMSSTEGATTDEGAEVNKKGRVLAQAHEDTLHDAMADHKTAGEKFQRIHDAACTKKEGECPFGKATTADDETGEDEGVEKDAEGTEDGEEKVGKSATSDDDLNARIAKMLKEARAEDETRFTTLAAENAKLRADVAKMRKQPNQSGAPKGNVRAGHEGEDVYEVEKGGARDDDGPAETYARLEKRLALSSSPTEKQEIGLELMKLAPRLR